MKRTFKNLQEFQMYLAELKLEQLKLILAKINPDTHPIRYKTVMDEIRARTGASPGAEPDCACSEPALEPSATSIPGPSVMAGEGTEPSNRPVVQSSPVEFTGKAGEYFRIWIVNLFLTIITLGIYSAWAKVRTRRYMYAHTSVAGHPFDYLAAPGNILKGHLIVAFFFILYTLAENFYPLVSLVLLALFFAIFPLLIYKALRFYTHNSSYRGIRFHFYGTLKDSYMLYLLKALLIPITLGLYYPQWKFLQKRWFFDNVSYGSTMSRFNGDSGIFYKCYILSYLITSVLFGVVFGIFIAAGALTSVFDMHGDGMSIVFVIIMFSFYGLLLLSGTLAQQYIYARTTNYCWEQAHLGQVRVKSTLQARKLVMIRVTNILAIIFSVGLLIPWAKIRRMAYVASCMQVEIRGSYDEFTATSGEYVSALGDAATDFFDFEIGL